MGKLKSVKWLKPDQPKRFILIWRNKWLTADAKTIGEMASKLNEAADQLVEMANAGVVLESSTDGNDDYALLSTTDPAVAKKFGLESDVYDEDEGEDD
jgi:hypothetical protein